MSNPTTAAEWAKECELAGHGPYRHSVISLPKDHPSKLVLCPECADAHARQRVREALEETEMLWVVLANVSGGDWTKQSQDWQDAAARARDQYFAALRGGTP
mgnify:CR=1 FL=1